MSQRAVRFVVVVGIAAVALGVAMWGLDPRAALALLLAFPPWMVPLVIGANTAITVLRAVRFRWLLNTDLPLWDVLAVTSVGFLAINVVPLRMGELARPALLSEVYGVPFGQALGAVVLERLLDMLALLVLLIGVSWLVVPGTTIEVAGVDLLLAGQRTFGIALGVGLVGVIALGVVGEPLVGVLERALGAVSQGLATRVGGLGRSFVHGLRTLAARPVRGLGALGATAAVWAASMGAVALSMDGFGIAVGPARVALNWACTVVALALVPTPGNVGTFEAGSVASLVIDGVPRELAQAFSLGNHAVMTGTTLAVGAAFLVGQRWSFERLVRPKDAAVRGGPEA